MIGLTPKQKKHFDIIVSFLTISLLGLFAFIVALFLLTEISTSPKQKIVESEVVQKGNYISEKDIAIEKNSLPIFEEFPDDFSTSTPKLYERQDGVARVVTRDELEKFIQQSSPATYPENYNQTESVPVDTSISVVPSPASSANVYVDPASGIRLGSISVGYGDVAPGTQQTPQIRQGVIFIIDKEKQLLQLNSLTEGTQTIKVTPETRYFVNGKPIMFQNLTETDVVYVEGRGYDSVSEVVAATISIIGRFEINTETN